MPDVATAYLVHATRGRLRVRVPERRRDIAWFRDAAARLSDCPGVEAIAANALTGSLLITGAVEQQDVIEFARARTLFEIVKAAPPDSPGGPSERWLSAMGRANRRFTAATGGHGDIGTALAAIFLVISVIQFARGQVAIPAVAALWYALDSLTLSRRWLAGPDGTEGT